MNNTFHQERNLQQNRTKKAHLQLEGGCLKKIATALNRKFQIGQMGSFLPK